MTVIFIKGGFLLENFEIVDDIRLHKELNLMTIKFGREIFVNLFYKLHKKFNKLYEPTILTMGKMEFWEFLGFELNAYNPKYFNELIGILTQNIYFKVNEHTAIGGSVFTTKLEDDEIKIAVTEFYKPYIFTKYELDMMRKAKNKEKLEPKELDYWDKTLKSKSKELVLLSEANVLNIKTKYGKRLYTLLGQFKHSKKFICKMSKFKELMEVPKSYRMSEIDKQVFAPAIKEIQEKTDIKNIKINKIKVGREIDKIEITFSVNPREIQKIKEAEQAETIENKEVKKEKISEFDILLSKITVKIVKFKNFVVLNEELSKATTIEELNKFIEKYTILI